MIKTLIDKLNREKKLAVEEWEKLIAEYSQDDAAYAEKLADEIRKKVYGNKIFIKDCYELVKSAALFRKQSR